jgi:uncharacterized membrane protein
MPDAVPGSVPQLDLLRGLAIVLMVVNHAGVRLLDPALQDGGAVAELVALGSFAPVVFFFTTGFGVGVSRGAASLASFGSTLSKVLLLLVADQFLFWKDGAAWGLDFLGFIAISTLLVTAVATVRRPLPLALGLLALIVLLRFGIGPGLRPRTESHPALAWLLGVSEVENVSYPLSPWLAYPLLGFVAARLYQSALVTGRRGRLAWWAALAAAVSLLGAAVLRALHASFFRWGTVSLGFFMLSIAVLLAFAGLCWVLSARWPGARRLLALRGIASLMVVPVHYACIELVAQSGAAPMGAAAWLAVTLLLAVVSIALSRALASAVEGWLQGHPGPASSAALAAVVAGCAAAAVLAPPRQAAAFAACVLGQLAIAAMLGARNRRRATRALPRTALS